MNVIQFILQNHMEVLDLTTEHLWLVGASITLAVLIGIPLGILITRWPGLSKPVLGGANIIFIVKPEESLVLKWLKDAATFYKDSNIEMVLRSPADDETIDRETRQPRGWRF